MRRLWNNRGGEASGELSLLREMVLSRLLVPTDGAALLFRRVRSRFFLGGDRR